MKYSLISIALFITMLSLSISVSSQDNVILDLESNSMGVLMPRMTTSDRFNMNYPIPNGLLVYDTDTESFWYHIAVFQSWVEIALKNFDQKILDKDGDTWVHTEVSPDTDSISFSADGSIGMHLYENPFGSFSMALGDAAHNIFIGDSSGVANQAILGSQGDRNAF